MMEFGVYTFGDLAGTQRGSAAAHQRLQEIVAAARLADQAGLQVLELVSITGWIMPFRHRWYYCLIWLQ